MNQIVIYSLSGKLIAKKDNYAVVDVGGMGYKVFLSARSWQSLPGLGQAVRINSFLNVRENALELYGFLTETDLDFFEKLVSVNGVGPKTALAITALAPAEKLAAAISEGKADLLTKASGIGKKTAERIILELKGKLVSIGSAEVVRGMESDLDVEEALVGLGYSRGQAKLAISRVDPKVSGLEERLKEALKKVKK